MELDGERRIPLPRAQVWTALNDPDVLRAAIPGCKALEKTSETTFTARVTSKIGPVSAAFSGTVELSDVVPGEAYTISGSGQGGVAGFAKGGARVTLADDGATATLLTYKATAEIGGKLASVGSRLLEGAARKTADQFFDGFVSYLAGSEAEAQDETANGHITQAGVGPPDALAAGTASDPPSRPASKTLAPAAALPSTLRIELGEIRVIHQLSPMTLFAAAGWVAAIIALLWRGLH